ncbi:stage III sporulation protein AF [Virgibacillus siamensis]|uniref:stage III sporulation protein AF n=1 Tax=Virgibacillus siamensis TaxID=480071 RepID=UPI0009869F19|nr:stage III sporulation protein AF [Virgibacillus siamensis]
MEVLIDWVSKIIIFLLLASIIDLLIPATSMKKYIKLVVGLILILILLKPVFYLFDVNIQQAVTAAFEQLDKENRTENQVKIEMKKQKNEIQASQHAYVLKQMTSELKKLAEDPLQQKYQADISDISYEFTTGSNPSYQNLQDVTVYLEKTDEETTSVNTVEHVTINTDKPATSEDENELEEITSLLYEIWEIPEDKLNLTVQWEGGSL